MSESDLGRPAPDPAPRPRPQYGEYATPEEQRARIRQPEVTTALETGQAPAEVAADAPLAATGSTDAAGGGRGRARSPRARAIDRFVTIGLLAYGFVTVIGSIPSFIDYTQYAETMLDLLGVQAELSDPAAARPWAVGASVLLALGWILTLLVSVASLRRGRLTWWIPLVGGAVVTFAAGTLMAVPLWSDPAVWQALQDSVLGG